MWKELRERVEMVDSWFAGLGVTRTEAAALRARHTENKSDKGEKGSRIQHGLGGLEQLPGDFGLNAQSQG